MLGRLAGFGAPNDRVFCPSCGAADADHQIFQHLEGESVSQARRQNIQPLVGITPETETNHQAHVQARRREAYLAGYTHSLRATGPNGKLLSNRALQTSDSSCEQSRAPPQAGTVPCFTFLVGWRNHRVGSQRWHGGMTRGKRSEAQPAGVDAACMSVGDFQLTPNRHCPQ